MIHRLGGLSAYAKNYLKIIEKLYSFTSYAQNQRRLKAENQIFSHVTRSAQNKMTEESAGGVDVTQKQRDTFNTMFRQ